MPEQTTTSNLVAFDDYIKSVGRGYYAGYKWRKDGLIQTVNIYGRLYVTRDEIARFEQRAISGEFSKQSKSTPPKARK